VRILGIYNDLTYNYVNYILTELSGLGHDTTSSDIIDYTGNIEIGGAPTFFIIKNDLPAYPLEGKHDLQTVISWVEASGL
jgi:hypothetical protein